MYVSFHRHLVLHFREFVNVMEENNGMGQWITKCNFLWVTAKSFTAKVMMTQQFVDHLSPQILQSDKILILSFAKIRCGIYQQRNENININGLRQKEHRRLGFVVFIIHGWDKMKSGAMNFSTNCYVDNLILHQGVVHWFNLLEP